MKGADSWLERVVGKREEDTAQRKADEKLSKERIARDIETAKPKKKGGKGKKNKKKRKK